MAAPKKTVLMVQLDSDQGKVWQTALESQQLEVVWEAANIDLVELLAQKQQNAVQLPDLLLIDTSIKSPNSEALQSSSVCSWCSKNSPHLKIVLFNPRQDEIREVERSWAVRRGAVDILPKLTQDNLITSVAQIANLLGYVLEQKLLEAIALSLPRLTPKLTHATSPKLDTVSVEANGTSKVSKMSKPLENATGDSEENYLMYRGVKIKRGNR